MTDLSAISEELCIIQDLPCMVCRVRHSTLDKPAHNPYGARAMEVHRHGIEWMRANAVDMLRFNRVLRPVLANRHKDDPLYKQDMTAAQVEAWLGRSEHNLWVLCDIHHRLLLTGTD